MVTTLNIQIEIVGTGMNLERPQSEAELEAILRSAYGLALKNQGNQALALCDWLIEAQETLIPGRRQRAAVLEYLGKLSEAIIDLEFVVSRGSREPADLHALGILYFKSGEMVLADTAFTSSLKLGAAARNAHYKNSSQLFRAQARLTRMDYKEALADAQQLPDQYATYVPGLGMRSKEQISVDAERELSRKEKTRFKFDRNT